MRSKCSVAFTFGRSIAPETDSSDFFCFDIRLASANMRKSRSPLNNRKNSRKSDDVFNIFRPRASAHLKILTISFARVTIDSGPDGDGSHPRHFAACDLPCVPRAVS